MLQPDIPYAFTGGQSWSIDSSWSNKRFKPVQLFRIQLSNQHCQTILKLTTLQQSVTRSMGEPLWRPSWQFEVQKQSLMSGQTRYQDSKLFNNNVPAFHNGEVSLLTGWNSPNRQRTIQRYQCLMTQLQHQQTVLRWWQSLREIFYRQCRFQFDTNDLVSTILVLWKPLTCLTILSRSSESTNPKLYPYSETLSWTANPNMSTIIAKLLQSLNEYWLPLFLSSP